MAFAPTTKELIDELKESDRLLNEQLVGINDLVREYTGRWYRGGQFSVPNQFGADEDSNPEPFSYSFVSNMLPTLVFSNPAVAVKARRVIGHKEFEQAMQAGLRGWLQDVPFKSELERVVLDFLFFQGVMMHFVEDDTRWSDGAVRPNAKWISNQKFGVDSLACSIDDAKYMYHWYWQDINDLMDDPDLDPEARMKIVPTDAGTKDQSEPFPKGNVASLARKRIKVYSVWMRESNTIRIICPDLQCELYAERPYYGPDTGPYTVFQAYPVPGQPYPLSPLVAVKDQVRDLQIHAKSAARSAARRKSVVIVDGTHGNLAEDVTNADDGEVMSVPGFSSSQMAQVDLAGVTPQQYEYLANLRQTLREHSGLTETTRGQVSGGTATEQSIASESLNNRVEFLRSKVTDGVAKVMHGVGWFLFHTPGIIIPVSRKDPLTGLEIEGLFFGGQFPGEESGTWDDYAIKIEPYSMQRVNEMVLQRRAMEFFELIMNVAPNMPMLPWVKWEEMLRMVGDAINQDDADQFIQWEMLGMMSRGEMMPPSQALGSEQPPNRYSIPGQGFKSRPGSEATDVHPSVNERRSEMSKPYGDEYGGTQGPPGSRGF